MTSALALSASANTIESNQLLSDPIPDSPVDPMIYCLLTDPLPPDGTFVIHPFEESQQDHLVLIRRNASGLSLEVFYIFYDENKDQYLQVEKRGDAFVPTGKRWESYEELLRESGRMMIFPDVAKKIVNCFQKLLSKEHYIENLDAERTLQDAPIGTFCVLADPSASGRFFIVYKSKSVIAKMPVSVTDEGLFRARWRRGFCADYADFSVVLNTLNVNLPLHRWERQQKALSEQKIAFASLPELSVGPSADPMNIKPWDL